MNHSIIFPLALFGTLAWNGGAAAFNPLQAIGDTLQKATSNASQQQQAQPQQGSRQEVTQQQSAAAQPAQGGDLGIAMAGKRQVVYEGYTKEMVPIKTLIATGKAADAYQQRLPKDGKLDDLDMLANLELGTMAIDTSMLDDARGGFDRAERILDSRDDQSHVGGFLSGTRDTVLNVLSGNAELGEYQGPGFERVLMLNYKSIAYLLDGERKAYNVTRRAIDLQNIEKKEFDALVREAKEKIEAEEAKQKEKGADLDAYGLDTVIEEQYQSTEKEALSVPHAFVNPFGFFVAGLVQELDSYEDPSLRDNAQISYKKALELNPKSMVIKHAVNDLGKPANRDRRFVGVIVADGFAPEKKLLKFDISLGASVPTIVELPIYVPVPSRVHRIEIQTTNGKRWAHTSEVADITALALRYQKDSGPIHQLRLMTTVVRNVIEGQMLNQAEQSAGVFGKMFSGLKGARDEMSHPDMRSWSTLPSRLLAARFFVPKSVSQIKVVAYDAKSRQLSSRVVPIDKDSHNLVYVRTLDNTLYTSSSKKMWVGS